jgi:hypothetical protein
MDLPKGKWSKPRAIPARFFKNVFSAASLVERMRPDEK